MPRILIAGYYGFGNIGDEAVLRSMLADFRRELPAATYCVTSDAPDVTSQSCGVDAVHWRDMPGVLKEVAAADLVVVGGGGLYNSYFQHDSSLLLTQAHSSFSAFLFGLPLLAYLNEKRCMVFGVGAADFRCENAKADAALGLALVDGCTVRDRRTQEIFVELGCTAEFARATADPAFRLENAPPDRIDAILAREQVPADSPLLGVVLRNWTFYGDPARTIAAVSAAAQRFIDTRGGRVLGLPFDTHVGLGELGDDRTILARFAQAVNRPGKCHIATAGYEPSEYAGLLGRCAAVMAMRLHPVVLSIKNTVPVLALEYDRKVAAILQWAGLADLGIDLAVVEADALCARIEGLLAEGDRLRRRLADAATAMRRQGEANIQTAVACLARPRLPRALTEATQRRLNQFTLKQTRLLVETQIDMQRSHALAVAEEKIASGQHDPALAALSALAVLSNRQPRELYLLAYCLHSLGREREQALRYYTLALEGGFAEFWVRYNRGALLADMGRADDALVDLQRATQLDPSHAGAQEVLKQLEESRPIDKSQ